MTLCHPERAFPAAIGEVCGAHDRVDGVHVHAFGKTCHRRACPQATIVAAYLPNAAGGDKLS